MPDRRDLVDSLNVEQFTAQAAGFAAAPTINDAAALAELVGLAGVGPADRVLDVACGPGIVSVHLAASGAEVVGIDLTPAMLALAVERVSTSSERLRARFVRGHMHALPFDVGEFSVVVCRYALHHTDDPGAAAREMARVTRPDGRVVVIDFAAVEDSAVARAYDEVERLRDPSHVRNLTALEQRRLFEPLGFVVQAATSYQLDVELEEVLARSKGTDHEGVRRGFASSLETHGLGVGARRVNGSICYAFPVAGIRLVRSQFG